jgi:hypothetical protein
MYDDITKRMVCNTSSWPVDTSSYKQEQEQEQQQQQQQEEQKFHSLPIGFEPMAFRLTVERSTC